MTQSGLVFGTNLFNVKKMQDNCIIITHATLTECGKARWARRTPLQWEQISDSWRLSFSLIRGGIRWSQSQASMFFCVIQSISLAFGKIRHPVGEYHAQSGSFIFSFDHPHDQSCLWEQWPEGVLFIYKITIPDTSDSRMFNSCRTSVFHCLNSGELVRMKLDKCLHRMIKT